MAATLVPGAGLPRKKRGLLRARVLLPVILVIAASAAVALAHRAGGPFRVVLFDRGDGTARADIEILSSFTFVLSGGSLKPAPFYEQRSVDVVVEHDLEFLGQKFRAGERLTSDGTGLVPEGLPTRLWNDLRYAVWRLEQPRRGRVAIRVREVSLLGGPRGISNDNGSARLGEPCEILDSDGDWLKVRDLDNKRRGWVHKLATTSDRGQIARLEEEGSAPRLLLLVEAERKESPSGMTIAGQLLTRRSDASATGTEVEPQAHDCVVFESAGLAGLAKPVKIHGMTIPDPRADQIYCFDKASRLTTRDLATFR
jgi:hypothetical protein